MPPYNTTTSSSESKQDGVGGPIAAAAAVADTAGEQEILAAVGRLEHYHSTKHHFHKPGRQVGARFGRIFVAGAGYVLCSSQTNGSRGSPPSRSVDPFNLSRYTPTTSLPPPHTQLLGGRVRYLHHQYRAHDDEASGLWRPAHARHAALGEFEYVLSR
jgi:hypothetical protein